MMHQAILHCQIVTTLAETQLLRQKPKMPRQVLPVAPLGGMQVTLAAPVNPTLAWHTSMTYVTVTCS